MRQGAGTDRGTGTDHDGDAAKPHIPSTVPGTAEITQYSRRRLLQGTIHLWAATG